MVPLCYRLGVKNFKTNKEMILHTIGFMTVEFFAKDALFAKHFYELTNRLDEHFRE